MRLEKDFTTRFNTRKIRYGIICKRNSDGAKTVVPSALAKMVVKDPNYVAPTQTETKEGV